MASYIPPSVTKTFLTRLLETFLIFVPTPLLGTNIEGKTFSDRYLLKNVGQHVAIALIPLVDVGTTVALQPQGSTPTPRAFYILSTELTTVHTLANVCVTAAL